MVFDGIAEDKDAAQLWRLSVYMQIAGPAKMLFEKHRGDCTKREAAIQREYVWIS